jgi:hemoglobin
LVDRFYARVEHDPVLRPIYPEDLEPGKRGLALFLGQYWGGPPAYSEARGQPMLRARHLPFAIDTPERDAWVSHMSTAVREGGLSPDDEAEFLTYVERAATHMINQHPLGLGPSRPGP